MIFDPLRCPIHQIDLLTLLSQARETESLSALKHRIIVPREIAGAFGAGQFLVGQRYLKMVERLISSLWLDAQSNFYDFGKRWGDFGNWG